MLTWKTESERPGVIYTIEKSSDAVTWEELTTVAGSNTGSHTYKATDETPGAAVNYYRLSYVDTDGSGTLFDDYVAIDNRMKQRAIVECVNLLGQPVPEDTPGVVIIRYENGETVRKFNP